MSSREFTEWQAFYRIDPFGFERFDHGFAYIAWMLVMINRDPKKPAPKFEDFLIQWGEVAEPSTQSKTATFVDNLFGEPQARTVQRIKK